MIYSGCLNIMYVKRKKKDLYFVLIYIYIVKKQNKVKIMSKPHQSFFHFNLKIKTPNFNPDERRSLEA